MSMSETQAFEAIYQHTKDSCAKCRIPYSCCSKEYCEMALDYAAQRGVELVVTGHERLPLMGEEGCTAPPHLRPLCSIHTCDIACNGTSGNKQWDRRYFKLRAACDEALAQHYG